MDDKALEYKIEIATQTLERNINFVASCDNKTSISLTIIGVLLTIILTNDGLNEIYLIVSTYLKSISFWGIAYLFIFAYSTIHLIYGIAQLVQVLIPDTTNKTPDQSVYSSKIFFSGIANNKKCDDYITQFKAMDKTELLNELIIEIYINAEICSKKYRTYTSGFKNSIIGFSLFVTLFIIGSILC